METTKTQVGGTHYQTLAIQPIEYIMKNGLGFAEGNIVKYVSRHAQKNKDEDIRKIIQYSKFILEMEYGYTAEQLKEL